MARIKKEFMDGYKTYSPETEGYGNPSEWRSAFNKRMGFEEATRIVADESPYSILGISPGATFAEIKTAYRKMAMLHHPDKHPNNQKEATAIMQKIIAAYTVLIEKFK